MKTKRPTSSKPAIKTTASALAVTPELIQALITEYKEHRDDLILAAHCIGLAIASYPDDHPLLKNDGIVPDGVTEWLLESAEELPKLPWLRLAEVLRTMFDLLLQLHPQDYGFSMALMTLSRPNLYDIHLRYIEEELVVDILDLREKPTLIAALKLSDECVDFYQIKANAKIH